MLPTEPKGVGAATEVVGKAVFKPPNPVNTGATEAVEDPNLAKLKPGVGWLADTENIEINR